MTVNVERGRLNESVATSDSGRRDRTRRLAVITCFLVSGATALVYEVVWVRLLTLVFGATVLSIGTVLAAYMAGLALGSWHWSRRADETSHPLRLYAFLEVGIAASALITPLFFQIIQSLYRVLFIGGLSDFSALSVVRFLLCLPALMLPTFLMGGTLPVLARFYTTSLSHIGRGAGDLYAVNTFGAVVGTLVSGFAMIPVLGVQGSLVTAACCNLLIAAVAYRLSRGVAAIEPARASQSDRLPVASDRSVDVVLVGFGLSGFAAMIFEVAWTRALIQIFGNSTYAFTTMLASFLVGIALGAVVAGRFIDRAKPLFFVFATLQLVLGAWAAAATPIIEYLPPLFLRAYERTGGSFTALQALQFQVCCLLMLPTTMGLGAVFPVVSKIFSTRARGAGTSVGVPYAANTIGTVLGAVTTGFLLLPHAGIEVSIVIGASLNLLVWAAVLTTSREMILRRSIALALGLLGALACAKLWFVQLNPQIMTAGIYMYPEYFLTMERRQMPIRDTVQLKKVLFHREGYSSSVAVLKLPTGDIVLQANGKTDASTGDLASQRAVAHLPLLLKHEAQDVLVVGLASGCTVGSALLHPVKRVDCIEIEPAMTTAAKFFDRWNHRCLQDGRLRLLMQDARNYVMMSDRQYDVITAEPTNPWIAGVNSLFTLEYYRHCRNRLRPDGIMCQWLPVYNFSTDELRTALATFCSVFPHVTVWSFPRLRSDFFAVGSMAPLEVNPSFVAKAMSGPVCEDLKAVGTENLWQLFAGLVMDEEATREFCRGAPLNTDEHPRLEFSTPRHLYESEPKARALEAAYAADSEIMLPFSRQLGHAVLRLMDTGVALPPNVSIKQACLVAYHPRDLTPLSGLRDIAELRLTIETPAGPATLRAAALPHAQWPESLRSQWPECNGAASVASLRERGGALLSLASLPSWRQDSIEVHTARAALLWKGPRSPASHR